MICLGCGIEIHPCLTGVHMTDEGSLCDDCYFDKLGDLVEQYPIGHPGRHGPGRMDVDQIDPTIEKMT